MRKIFLLFSLFLLGTPLFAQSCFGQQLDWVIGSDNISDSTGNINLARSPTLIYAIGLIVVIIAIAYMLGRAWGDQKLTFWAKTESINFGISIILVLVVLGAFLSSCEISQAIAGIKDDVSPAQTASMGLKNISDTFGIEFAKDLLESSVNDQFQSMYYAYWTIPAMDGGGLSYRANKKAASAQKELLIDLYLPLLMMVDMQRLFLEVALPGIIGVILPSALFFRIIFATRDMGNLLIALAFSIYFVLPLMYILSFGATEQVIHNLNGTADNPFIRINDAVSGVVGDAFIKIGFVSAFAILIPNIAAIGVVTMTMSVYKALRGFGV